MVMELGIRSGSRCLYGCSLLALRAWMVRDIEYRSSWNSNSDLKMLRIMRSSNQDTENALDRHWIAEEAIRVLSKECLRLTESGELIRHSYHS